MKNEDINNMEQRSKVVQDEIDRITNELEKNDISIDENKIANHVENRHINNVSREENEKNLKEDAERHFSQKLGTETNNIAKNIASEFENLKTLFEEFLNFLKENKEIQKLSNSNTVKNAKKTLSETIDNNSVLKGAVAGLATGGAVGAIRGGAVAGVKSIYDKITSNNDDNSDVLSKDAIFDVLNKKKMELENKINEHIENMDIVNKDELKIQFKDIVNNLGEDKEQDEEISNFVDKINGDTTNKELVKEATEEQENINSSSGVTQKRRMHR